MHGVVYGKSWYHCLTSIYRLCRELTMPVLSGTAGSVLKCGSNVLGVVQAGGR